MSARNISPKQFESVFKRVPGGTAQVPLWAFPNEITGHPDMDYIDLNSAYHEAGVRDLRHEKVTESQDEHVVGNETLYDSIERHGVKKPVTIDAWDDSRLQRDAAGNLHVVKHLGLMVRGGHHRLFSAEDIDDSSYNSTGERTKQTMVPLRYDDRTERHQGSWNPDAGEYEGRR
jgi:hypothetical protein